MKCGVGKLSGDGDVRRVKLEVGKLNLGAWSSGYKSWGLVETEAGPLRSAR